MRSFFWILFDSLLFAFLFIVLGLIFYCQQGEVHYADGMNGTHVGTVRILYALFAWISVVCVIPIIALRLYFWKSVITNLNQLLLLRLITVIVLCIAICVLAIIPTFTGKSHLEYFADGYRDWAKTALEVDEIRNWISTFDGEKAFTISFDKDFDGPKCLHDNRSRFSAGLVGKDENGQMYLRLHSGGGFQDWGVFIGPKDMEVSSFEIMMFEESSGEYRYKLEDGAYVWNEIQ